MAIKHIGRGSVVLCSIGIIVLLGLAACAPPTPPEPEQAESIKLKGIFPGKTTREEVIRNLGEPAKSEMEEGMEVLEYPSAHELMPHGVYLKDDVVVLVGAHISEEDDFTVSEVIAKYGEPAKKTYSYYSDGAFTYIYPSRGLALIVNEDLDVVFEEQCFIPMSLEEYMQTWGKDLPLENPYTK